MNADGSGVRLVTDQALGEARPSWLPDGRIIFTKGADQAYVVNVDGSGRMQLTKGKGVGDIAASPDGKLIAYPSSAAESVVVVPLSGAGAPVTLLKPIPDYFPEDSYSGEPAGASRTDEGRESPRGVGHSLGTRYVRDRCGSGRLLAALRCHRPRRAIAGCGRPRRCVPTEIARRAASTRGERSRHEAATRIQTSRSGAAADTVDRLRRVGTTRPCGGHGTRWPSSVTTTSPTPRRHSTTPGSEVRRADRLRGQEAGHRRRGHPDAGAACTRRPSTRTASRSRRSPRATGRARQGRVHRQARRRDPSPSSATRGVEDRRLHVPRRRDGRWPRRATRGCSSRKGPRWSAGPSTRTPPAREPSRS